MSFSKIVVAVRAALIVATLLSSVAKAQTVTLLKGQTWDASVEAGKFYGVIGRTQVGAADRRPREFAFFLKADNREFGLLIEDDDLFVNRGILLPIRIAFQGGRTYQFSALVLSKQLRSSLSDSDVPAWTHDFTTSSRMTVSLPSLGSSWSFDLSGTTPAITAMAQAIDHAGVTGLPRPWSHDGQGPMSAQNSQQMQLALLQAKLAVAQAEAEKAKADAERARADSDRARAEADTARLESSSTSKSARDASNLTLHAPPTLPPPTAPRTETVQSTPAPSAQPTSDNDRPIAENHFKIDSVRLQADFERIMDGGRQKIAEDNKLTDAALTKMRGAEQPAYSATLNSPATSPTSSNCSSYSNVKIPHKPGEFVWVEPGKEAETAAAVTCANNEVQATEWQRDLEKIHQQASYYCGAGFYAYIDNETSNAALATGNSMSISSCDYQCQARLSRNAMAVGDQLFQEQDGSDRRKYLLPTYSRRIVAECRRRVADYDPRRG